MFPRDHKRRVKGLACKHHPRAARESTSECFAARSCVFSLLASQAIKGYGFFAVSQCLVGKMILAIICVIFFRTRWLLLDMTEPNYGWLLLTLISRLEIRKKESGRPQAVDLSFLRATRGGRRESAKSKILQISPGRTLCKALKQSNVQNHSYFDSVINFIFLYGIK